MTMTIKIVLADDHHIVREGFRMVLEAQPDFLVIGEASDGIEAVRVVESLKPDVLVVDLMMPGLNGLEVAHQLRNKVRIVVLSMHNNEAYVIEALKNGVYGYVLKDATSKEFVQAVQYAAAGKRYLSAPFSEKPIENYIQDSETDVQDPYDLLTNREREILYLVAQGNSNTEIGELLHISSRTVEVHRANLMRKLNFHTQADLIRYALKRGILPMDN
jgi:DNA-binding NarL/FixJ family response regulator